MGKKKRCKSDKKEETATGKFACKKCGLTAQKEKNLCKPTKPNKSVRLEGSQHTIQQ